MTYGTRIKQAREERYLTQEQLAEELDISRQAVSKWEAGLSKPTREKLDRLSEILDIPPETWAEIEEEMAAANAPPDTSRPWKLATAALAAVCAVLTIALIVALRPSPEEPPDESVTFPVAVDPSYENEPIPDPDEDSIPVIPESFPLAVRRDYDFGDQPFGVYDPAEVPFLEDWEKVMEEELWCGWFPDGTRLSLVPVADTWDETGERYNVYLLYAPPAKTTNNELEYHILFRIAEDFTGDDRGNPEGKAFINLLGYDGFKVSISAADDFYRLAHYITQRPDGTPCMMTTTLDAAYEFDVDEDGRLEIVCYDKYIPGWEIIDTAEGEEGAFVYTLDYTKTEPEWGQYLLGFDENRGGFIILDGAVNSVVRYCVLRNGELVCVPPTDFSAIDYPDVVDTELIFVIDYEQSQGISDELDPDVILPYNPDARIRITHRQQAYLALQELYNMTGIRLESCYCAASEFSVCFSAVPDGFNQRSFFHVSFGEDRGGYGIPSFHISWQELGNDWSPLSFAEAALPEGETVNDQILWYYTRMNAFNTGEVDHLNCLPLEPDAWQQGYEGAGEFYLTDGSLFNVFYQIIGGKTVLTSLYGPYPDGFAHH